ncbi:MAG TPA: tRNA pseudouridine(55) synthase TruB [Solirubrobacteraceae bacterium]|nr:tRNA pseudouridine(55) synthase TruB [Solirubrobacteraceae bacterium]
MPGTGGILLIDKPAGKTSHDVVAAVRREHHGTRVGHAGTLDPFATGLLLVLLGRATRVQRWLMAADKEYSVVARLGAISSTGDTEGEITVTGRVPPPGAALPVGEIRQRPPAYSAVKVGGQRAYRLARAGEAVRIPERTVMVRSFREVWREEASGAAPGPRAGYRVRCSSGTYVRSLIADLGDAYCLELRREAIGPFRVEDADPARVVPLGEALAAVMPVLELEAQDARAAAHGRAVPARGDQGTVASGDVPAAPILLADAAGPIAVAQVREGVLKPVVGFRG